MKTLSFFVNNKIHKVYVHKTKNKNMYLKVKDGGLIVTAPIFTTEKTIKNFVELHIKDFVVYLDKEKSNKLFCLIENFIIYRGQKYKINILTGFKKRNIKIVNKTFYLETKEGLESETIPILKKFLKEQTSDYVSKRINYFEKLMKTQKHDFIVSYKTTSWGTNFIGKEKISFSSRLSHFEEEVTDYVIVHELSHTSFPNHSKDFWNNVSKYKENYKKMSNKLKNI